MDRRCIAIAHFDRGRTDYDIFSGKGCRIELAHFHGDEAVTGKGVGLDGEINQKIVVRDTGTLGELRRQRRARGIGVKGPDRHFAHEPVACGTDRHGPEQGVLPQLADGQRIELPFLGETPSLAENRENDGRICIRQRGGEPLVLLAVRSGGEIDVEGDRARACLVEPFNDLRIMLAIPRPPLDGGNARRIHLDYVDLTAGGVRAHREACILQHVFKRL